jgi:hypothetical protein
MGRGGRSLRLAGARLAVTTAAAALATAGRLSAILDGLLAVVVAARVAVTESYRRSNQLDARDTST